jgi:hypothetical protein
MDERQAQAAIAFASQAAHELRRLDAGLWRERTQGRLQELDAAFEWFLDHDAAEALAMASTLAEFLRISGRATIARSWLDRALAAAAADDPRRAEALYEDGLLAFWQGANAEARSLHERSLDLAPTSREISSTSTPASDSRDTKECRSSRGVQSFGSRPGTRARARRKSRRTLAASSGSSGPGRRQRRKFARAGRPPPRSHRPSARAASSR